MFRKLLISAAFITAVAVYSQKSDAIKLVNSGMEAERTSNYTEALFYYTMAIDMDSKYADAYEKRADLYRKLKNYGKAKQDYAWAANLNPTKLQVWINLGIMNYELTSYKDAVTIFTKAIELSSGEANLYFYRGNAYNKNNEFDKAGQDYNKAISLNSDFNEAREKLNKLYEENKITWKPEEQKEIVKNEEVKTEEVGDEIKNPEHEIISSPSQSIQDIIFEGLAYYEKKDFLSALDKYQKAVETDPAFAEAYYHKGRAYTELGDFNSAINEYTKTIELNPGHEKAYINRGFIYNEMKEYNKAISDFQRGVEINPNSVIGFYNMGIAYYGLGNKSKTAECFRNAARLGDSDSQDWLKSNGYDW